MQRVAYSSLLRWKDSPGRKPLIVRGARQVGKTWLLREFARREYPNHVYLNFEEDPQASSLFSEGLSPDRVVRNLTIYAKAAIEPGRTLILLDEVQRSNDALNSLKYFQEQAPGYHVAAAGSLLGIRVSGAKSFPVGKVNFLDLRPLSLLEFLRAHGESGFAQLIEEIRGFAPLPDTFHRRLVEWLRLYLFIGGMPEAVAHHAQHRDLGEVRRIQAEIVRAYALDFAKHAPTTDIPKLSLVWESVPAHLARENRKFVYSALRPGARAREYENAIAWLADAELILRAFNVTAPRIPLAAYARSNAFKVYALDVGLLCAQTRLPERAVLEGHRLFQEFRGALTENYVAQELACRHGPGLRYWTSESGRAEVDFLHEQDGRLFPLEVKAGVNPKSKSLAQFGRLDPSAALSRTTLLNLEERGRIRNYPLYAVCRFPVD